ncbi:MAG: hypothetical protein IT462_00860 [Planctomycetes bacterium]|nr:hypothetical protein [Planctomycetota bacterium]
MKTALKLILASISRLSSRLRARIARRAANLSRGALRLLASGLFGRAGLRLGQVVVALSVAAAFAGGLDVKADAPVSARPATGDSFPRIAKDADGDGVVVWQSIGASGYHDGDGWGVYARRFTSSDNNDAKGFEFRVNTTITGFQGGPDVAMDADGDFVVVWTGADSDSTGIFGQRFDADGAPVGGEFRVNSTQANSQVAASVAMDADGNFTVVWQSYIDATDENDILARQFAEDGTPLGGEFGVNGAVANDQFEAAIAMDADGNFAVVWTAEGGDSDGYGVKLRLFDAAGNSLGSDTPVNVDQDDDQHEPDIAMDVDGDFVVVWTSLTDISYNSTQWVIGRRYDAAGQPQGGEIPIATNSNNFDYNNTPSVAMSGDGDFVVAWHYDFSGAVDYVSAAGFVFDGSVNFNRYTLGASNVTAGTPDIAMDADGDYQVVWAEYNYFYADGSNSIVVEEGKLLPWVINASPWVTGVFLKEDHHLVREGEGIAQDFQYLIIAFSEDMDSSFLNNGTINLVFNGVNVPVLNVDYYFNDALNRYEAELFFGVVPQGEGNYTLTLGQNIEDFAGIGLDGDFDGAAGGDYVLNFSVRTPQARGDDVQANTFETGLQFRVDVARDADGDSVAVWQSKAQDSGAGYGIYGQRYNPAGAPVGAEFLVNMTLTGNQTTPACAMDADGNFVVVWEGDGSYAGSDDQGIFVRIFNADGTPRTGEFIVNQTTFNDQQNADVAMDHDGDFVVVWDGYGSYNSADSQGIFYRVFRPDGSPRHPESRANKTHAADNQFLPAVAMDADGDFTIAWQGWYSGYYGYHAAIWQGQFDNGGIWLPQSEKVSGFEWNSSLTQVNPGIAMDVDGDFVVTWWEYNEQYLYSSGSNGGFFDKTQVRARVFHADGSADNLPFIVSNNATGNAKNPACAMDADGDFAIAWAEYNYAAPVSRSDTYVRRYNFNGDPQGPKIAASTRVSRFVFRPAVAMDAQGDFVVAFNSYDTSGAGAFFHRFAADNAPTTSGLADVVADENDDPILVDLGAAFADAEDSDAELVFAVVGNTNPALVAAGISGDQLGLAFFEDEFGTADITVRATDSSGLWVEDTFTVTVNEVTDPVVTPPGGDDDDGGCAASSTTGAGWGLLAVLMAMFGGMRRLVRRRA